MYALALGHYVTRAFMAEAAQQEGLDPDRLSFLNCLRVLRNRAGEYAGKPARQRAESYEAVLADMADERIGARRNRINPRVVKVKMSKFKKKRRGHKGIPPLSKTFEDSIILLAG